VDCDRHLACPGRARIPATRGAVPEPAPLASYREALAPVGALERDLVERLARYEAHGSSEYSRTLAHLERLQRLRGGEELPAPARLALDVTRPLRRHRQTLAGPVDSSAS